MRDEEAFWFCRVLFWFFPGWFGGRLRRSLVLRVVVVDVDVDVAGQWTPGLGIDLPGW